MDETNKPENKDGESSGTWAWVVTGLVVFAAIAGLYSWPKKDSTLKPTAENQPQEEVDVQAQVLQQISDSDDVNAIDLDLKNTDFSNLDKEVADIQTEINPQQHQQP